MNDVVRPGRLVAVEGIDGAGKHTLTRALTQALHQAGARVRCRSFPRYGNSVYADLIREALHSEHGDLGDSVYGMALLYALDRRDAAAEIRADLAGHDVVLIDRYIASNAAYQAARLHQDVDDSVVQWVRGLEIDRFELPAPDVHVLLDVAPDVAAARADERAVRDVSRTKDAFESDTGLQERCAALYRMLAATSWLSPWHVVQDTGAVDTDHLADALLSGI